MKELIKNQSQFMEQLKYWVDLHKVQETEELFNYANSSKGLMNIKYEIQNRRKILFTLHFLDDSIKEIECQRLGYIPKYDGEIY